MRFAVSAEIVKKVTKMTIQNKTWQVDAAKSSKKVVEIEVFTTLSFHARLVMYLCLS